MAQWAMCLFHKLKDLNSDTQHPPVSPVLGVEWRLEDSWSSLVSQPSQIYEFSKALSPETKWSPIEDTQCHPSDFHTQMHKCTHMNPYTHPYKQIYILHISKYHYSFFNTVVWCRWQTELLGVSVNYNYLRETAWKNKSEHLILAHRQILSPLNNYHFYISSDPYRNPDHVRGLSCKALQFVFTYTLHMDCLLTIEIFLSCL